MKKTKVIAALMAVLGYVDSVKSALVDVKTEPVKEVIGVVSGPEGTIVLGEWGEFWITQDLNSWTKSKIGDQAIHFKDITYGNGVYLAIGVDANIKHPIETYIYTSEDGEIWDQDSMPYRLEGVKHLDDGFYYGFDNSGGILKSLNGKEWEVSYSGNGDSQLLDVIVAEGYYIAVGKGENNSQGVMINSEDGEEWEANPAIFDVALRDIAYLNGRTVIATGTERVFVSNGEWVWNPIHIHDGISFVAVEASNDKIYLAGNQGNIVSTKDGENWGFIETGEPHHLTMLSIGDVGFLATWNQGEEGIIVSEDGQTWNNVFSWNDINMEVASNGSSIKISVKTDPGINVRIEETSDFETWEPVYESVSTGYVEHRQSNEISAGKFFRVKTRP